MSGYDIKQLIQVSIGHFWNESYGQIYPSLRRLEADGLIEEVSGGGGGGRGRREFRLNDAGLRVLRSWLAEPAHNDVVRYETSLKLFFGAQTGPAATGAHVRRYRDLQQRLLKGYRSAAEQLEREHAASPHLPYWRAVLDGGMRYATMAIEWCEATLEDLDRLEETA